MKKVFDVVERFACVFVEFLLLNGVMATVAFTVFCVIAIVLFITVSCILFCTQVIHLLF